MFYFKTETIDNPNPAIVEKAIRSYSLKRHTSLDLKRSAGYDGEEKYFLGLEKENSILLTRIRTPFERIFPKLIVRFKKSDEFTSYQIRFSLPSTVLSCIVLLGLLIDLSYLLSDDFNVEGAILLILLLVLFFVFTLLEIAMTKNRINKAILQTSAKEFLDI